MSIGQHFKGVKGGTALYTNSISDANKSTNIQSGSPNDEQLKIDYGEIAEVDYEVGRVRINRLVRGNELERIGKTRNNKDGAWIPILQPLTVIHMLYGALRPKLTVRIFWKGKNNPGPETMVEVISEKPILEFITGAEKPRSNELYTGPRRLFLGGKV